MVLAEALLALAEALDERVAEALEVAGCLPRLRVEDDRAVEGHDVVALLDHRAPPLVLDVRLEQHAVVPVVVRGAEPAVDLGRLEQEAAPLAERDDLVHRDRVRGFGSHAGQCSGWAGREPRTLPRHPPSAICHRPPRTAPPGTSQIATSTSLLSHDVLTANTELPGCEPSHARGRL